MPPLLTAYAALGLAIVCEVAGTTFLQKSAQFTKPLPTIAMIVMFMAALFFLSQALKLIALGPAYAIWSGVGMVLTALISVVVFGFALDRPAILGIGLIIAGVVVINLFSNSVSH